MSPSVTVSECGCRLCEQKVVYVVKLLYLLCRATLSMRGASSRWHFKRTPTARTSGWLPSSWSRRTMNMNERGDCCIAPEPAPPQLACVLLACINSTPRPSQRPHSSRVYCLPALIAQILFNFPSLHKNSKNWNIKYDFYQLLSTVT